MDMVEIEKNGSFLNQTVMNIFLAHYEHEPNISWASAYKFFGTRFRFKKEVTYKIVKEWAEQENSKLEVNHKNIIIKDGAFGSVLV